MSILPTSQSFSPVTTAAAFTPAGSVVSSAASSRTLTALPGGGVQVDDTFVRRSIIQPNNWMGSIGAASACAPCAEAMAPAAAPAPKRKKKKKGLKGKLKKMGKKVGGALKKGVKAVGKLAKSALKFAHKLATLPFKAIQMTTGLDLDPTNHLKQMFGVDVRPHKLLG